MHEKAIEAALIAADVAVEREPLSKRDVYMRAAIAAFLASVEPSEEMQDAGAGVAATGHADAESIVVWPAQVWRAMASRLAEELK